MANFIIRKTERDYREAAHKAGLAARRYSGLARSEEEAHEVTRRRGGDKPDAALAFDDGGQADREMYLRSHGASEETWERTQHAIAKRRRAL